MSGEEKSFVDVDSYHCMGICFADGGSVQPTLSAFYRAFRNLIIMQWHYPSGHIYMRQQPQSRWRLLFILNSDQTLLWHELHKNAMRPNIRHFELYAVTGVKDRATEGALYHTPPHKIWGCVSTLEKGWGGSSTVILCSDVKGRVLQWFSMGLLWERCWGWTCRTLLTIIIARFQASNLISDCQFPQFPWLSVSSHCS